MTAVKFCGFTREVDVEAAVDLGVDAVGVVAWLKSPRAVTASRARDLLAGVPRRVARVGVFVNASAAEIASFVEEAQLDVVQLHGDEPLSMVHELTGQHRVMRAVTDSQSLMAAEADGRRPRLRWLVDAHDPRRRGGTGSRADWVQAARLARKHPIVLAGGIGAANLLDAIAAVNPAAIDVSSSIETSPGVKDTGLMRALMACVREVEPDADGDECPARGRGFIELVFGETGEWSGER